MAIQWRVLYQDGTIEEGYDNLSKQAFQNPDVVYFTLFVNNCRYSVNLEDGTISLNHVDIISPFFNKNVVYRLIYYRICSQTLPVAPLNYVETYEMPYFGWQTTTDGHNHKIIYAIDSENKIVQVI